MKRQTGTPSRRAVIVVASLIVAACASSPAANEAPRDSAGSSPAAPASLVLRSASAGTSLSLVGLGDSMPGGMHCDDPCRTYVVVYGELASKALGRPVNVTNLATNDGLQTDQLLARIRTDPTHRAALADADLITVTIGNNDWEGPCYWDGHASCFEHGRTTVERSLGLILDETATLRGTRPTAIRVTTQYDTWIGNPSTAGDWGFGSSAADLAAFHVAFKTALTDYNATVCRVAIAHRALCIDIAPAFNGPDPDRDAGPLLGGDHAHPSTSGHELIAATIAAAGYAPIQ